MLIISRLSLAGAAARVRARMRHPIGQLSGGVPCVVVLCAYCALCAVC